MYGLPSLPQITRSGFTFATSSAIKPNCGVAVLMDSCNESSPDSALRSTSLALVHRFDFSLVTARGTGRAELTRRIDHHWYCVVNCRCDAMNIADKAAVVHVRAIAADTDNVSGCCNAGAGRLRPNATFSLPVVLKPSAPIPIAVLESPVVLI